MLNYIHLENFRAFAKPTTIPLAPITLFFGENSAGKTSILHALSLLKQTVESEDPNTVLVVRDAGGIVDLGSFREFVSDHDTKRILRLGIGIGSEGASRVRTYLRQQSRPLNLILRRDSLGVDLAFRLSERTKDIEWESVALTDGKSNERLVTFRPHRESPVEIESDAQVLEASQPAHLVFRAEDSTVSPAAVEEFCNAWRQHADDLVNLLSSVDSERLRGRVAFGFDDRADVAQRLVAALAKWASLCSPSVPNEDLREALHEELRGGALPSHRMFGGGYASGSSQLLELFRAARPAARRMESSALQAIESLPLLDASGKMRRALSAMRHALDALIPIGPFRRPAERLYTYSGTRPHQVGRSGERVADFLHREPRALERTNRWLKTFGIDYRLELKALGARRSDVFELRLIDERRRPRIDIAFTDVGFGISQLLPIIVQSVGFNDRVISIEQPEVHVHPRLQAEIGDLLVDCVKHNRHQFLVETHSEHLILRLRKLVREKKCPPEMVAVIYVGRGKDGAFVEQIGLKPDGSFSREWPGGFFPERLRELT